MRLHPTECKTQATSQGKQTPSNNSNLLCQKAKIPEIGIREG